MHPIVALLRPYEDPEYLAEQRRVDIIRARIAAFYALVVYGGFWGLDWIAYPEHALSFGLLRAVMGVLGLAVGIWSYVKPGAPVPQAARVLGILCPALIA